MLSKLLLLLCWHGRPVLQESCSSRRPIQAVITDQCDYDCDSTNINVSELPQWLEQAQHSRQ
jgi:hypothetical protein